MCGLIAECFWKLSPQLLITFKIQQNQVWWHIPETGERGESQPGYVAGPFLKNK
jgi:hypothetical protein